jgi:GTP pyrophosphokinase
MLVPDRQSLYDLAGCSDTYETPKPAWRTRKETYLRHLREASGSVRLVAAADKLHNARSILSDLLVEGDKVFARFTATKQDTLWYYREVVATLKANGPRRRARELELVVAEIERLSAD